MSSCKFVNPDDGFSHDEAHYNISEVKPDYDISGKSAYLNACRLFNIVPASYFIRHMQDETLKMGHHGLGILGAKALSYPLMVSISFLDRSTIIENGHCNFSFV